MDFGVVTSKEGDKTSVWHCFLINKNKNEAKCKTCQKVLKSAGGSTSSLRRHLKNIHAVDIEAARHSTIETTAQGSASSSKEIPEAPKKKTKLTHYYETDANPSMQVMVSRMAAVDGIPLRTFSKSQDLKYLFEKTGNKLPTTADTVRNIILKDFDKRKLEIINEIKIILSDEKKFSISFDEWTSIKNRRYIGLTLHSPNFARDSSFRNLGLIRIHGSMNAASCVKLIEAKCDEYGVSLTNDIVAQTTDGCSLIVALGKSLKSCHQLCIAHAVQLAIVDVMYKRNAGFEENVAQLAELDEDEDLPLSVLAQRLRTVEFNDDTNSTDNDEDGVEFNNESSFMESFSSQSFRYNDLLSKVRKVEK
ncbi:unnamed protein product [Arctia plantaginis]|uniref:BED-type domain-containing protein n=1 Tax=Arctia plantaginis TaxID=874455 RepID=A0A8S0YNF1_ARCPL|nr:unnamed protein product [Arctia plantaginis]